MTILMLRMRQARPSRYWELCAMAVHSASAVLLGTCGCLDDFHITNILRNVTRTPVWA